MLGVYYDGKSSERTECCLLLNDSKQLVLNGIGVSEIPLDDVSISPRIADSRRFITFPGGAIFETLDNDAVDALQFELASSRQWFFIHYWERNKKLILLSAVACTGFIYLLLAFGIPVMSRNLAYALPASVSTKLASEVLETLDENVLTASVLSERRQEELRTQFNSLGGVSSEFQLRLHFRKGNLIGANAFALPDGAVVMTDELIALADNDLQLQSVMLHEIGHVVHRHSLRRLIENSSTALILVWLTEDIEAGSSLFTALPAILLQSGYSRDTEREADGYALERMLEIGISPQHFASMMKKLDSSESGDNAGAERDSYEPDAAEGENGPKQAEERSDDGHHWFDYISSHPTTASRIQRFEEAAALHQPGQN